MNITKENDPGLPVPKPWDTWGLPSIVTHILEKHPELYSGDDTKISIEKIFNDYSMLLSYPDFGRLQFALVLLRTRK